MKPKILSLQRFILFDLLVNTAYYLFCGLFIIFSFLDSKSDNALSLLFFVLAVLAFVVCSMESHVYDNEGLRIFKKIRYVFLLYRIFDILLLWLISSLSTSLIGVGVGIGVLAIIYYAIFAAVFFKTYKNRLNEYAILTLYDDSEDSVRIVRHKFFMSAVFFAAAIACIIWCITEIISTEDYIWVSAELFALFALLCAYDIYSGIVIYKNYKKDEADKKYVEREEKEQKKSPQKSKGRVKKK